MVLGPRCTIRFVRPAVALGKTMEELRVWFDTHRLQPSSFIVANTTAGIAFDLGFLSERGAIVFEAGFSQ